MFQKLKGQLEAMKHLSHWVRQGKRSRKACRVEDPSPVETTPPGAFREKFTIQTVPVSVLLILLTSQGLIRLLLSFSHSSKAELRLGHRSVAREETCPRP